MKARHLALLVFCACGQSSPQGVDAGCRATFAGNSAGSATVASCASLSTAADGGSDGTLRLDLPAATSSGVTWNVEIDLGDSPQAGDFSSRSASRWSALGIVGSNHCVYSAGALAVPPGNFTLTLTAAGSDPHGTFHAEQWVQAPVSTDCGPGDTETIDLTF
jgi:hypothetical protein